MRPDGKDKGEGFLMDAVEEKFFQCVKKAVQAEKKKKYSKMWQYVAKAETFPLRSEYQKWTLGYMKAVYTLRYGAGEEREEATRKLLGLWREAKGSYVLRQLAHEDYVYLLVNLLHKNYDRIAELPEYGELAKELVQLVEEEQRHTLDGTDLYALAYTMLAQYYGIAGQIGLKGECLGKVWEAAKEASVLSGYAFCALVTYLDNLQFQARFQDAVSVCLFLVEKLCSGETDGIVQGDVNQYIVNACNLFQSMGDGAMALRLAEDALREGMVRPWKDSGQDSAVLENMLGVYSCYLFCLLSQGKGCPKGRLREITEYLERYQRDFRFPSLKPWSRSNFYLAYYRRDRLARDPQALKHLGQCAQILLEEGFGEGDRMPFLINIIEVIQEYRALRKKEQAAGCVDRLMHKLLEFYAMAEYYQENQEMEAYFGICRLGFEIAYLAVGDAVPAWKRMEYRLNGKNLLSTAIRFRNQLDISQIRDRKKHPDAFPYYTLHQLEEKLPEDTAVLEFLYMDPEVYQKRNILPGGEGKRRVLEIFVAAKKEGRIRFSSRKMEEDGETGRWVQKIGEQMEAQAGGGKALFRKLFGKILEPFTEELKQIGHLWACPDQELSNAPFEVILDSAAEGWACQEIVYWQSLRDIFQSWRPKEGCGKNVCAIGSPDYARRQAGGGADVHPGLGARWIQEQITPLPFSGYEARKVAGLLKSPCYTHQDATKNKVAPGCRYLHIATHGYSSQEGGNAWYESSLAFSGIVDYLGTGVEGPDYGNGILTAEEISRMRLEGTEVAVLSACNSGNSLLTGLRQQAGLHVAFGVAGVKYVVAALWSADDLATAVFMDYFYKSLLEGLSVPQAACLARKQLRGVSAKEVLALLEEDEALLPPEAAGVMASLRELPGDCLLYNSPAYWGNFLCYGNMR